MNGDWLTRIISEELNVRAYTVVTLDTSKEIVSRHDASPPAAMSMARTINAAALLSSTLKPDTDQNLSVKFSGTGPLKEIHVQVDAKGNVRGYVANPQIGPADIEGGPGFSRLIGAGFLTIIKDIGLREPYYSTIPLQLGDIAGDVAHYLTYSEQTPSALIIAVKMNDEFHIVASGGILVQVFPETNPSVIMEVENRITSNKVSLGAFLQEGGDINAFLSDLLGNAPITIHSETPLRHNCRCSRDMLGEIIGGFSATELEDMINRDNGAEIECTFCKNKYLFTGKELASIAHAKRGAGLN